jgi:membrane-associated phospholipid phosphatase
VRRSTLPIVSARVTVPLLAALACLVGFAVTAVLALAVPAAHEHDAALLQSFMAFERTRVYDPLLFVVGLGDPLPYALAGLGLVVVALAQRRTWRAVAVAALLTVTGASTQVLKYALATPRFDAFLEELDNGQIGDAAFPSGHATAAMTLALCAVLVVPPAWRTVTALAGWAFAAAMGYALVVLSWHYPSDVLGGYLMAGMWTALALAGLHAIEKAPVPAAPWRPAVHVVLAVVGGTALSALLVLAASRETVMMFSPGRPTLAIGTMVIAALAGALAAAFARAA